MHTTYKMQPHYSHRRKEGQNQSPRLVVGMLQYKFDPQLLQLIIGSYVITVTTLMSA